VKNASLPGTPSLRIVVVFGDSITAGNELPDPAACWVSLVQRQTMGHLEVINEGKGGRLTDSIQEFGEMLLRHPRADLLVLALGTNDSRTIKEECVPNAVANLRSMIRLARMTYGPNLAILLIGPPNLRKDTLGPTRNIADMRNAKLRELGTAYQVLAHETDSGFLSFYGALPPESLAKDGVHPDAAGNEQLAKLILPVLLA